MFICSSCSKRTWSACLRNFVRVRIQEANCGNSFARSANARQSSSSDRFMASPTNATGSLGWSEASIRGKNIVAPHFASLNAGYGLRAAEKSAAHIERRQRRHVDQRGVLGAERHDLHRPVEA